MNKKDLGERDICSKFIGPAVKRAGWFSSNGDGFIFHDRTGASPEKEATLSLDAFPSPNELWSKYRALKGLTPDEEAIVLQDHFEDGSDKGPRYYQTNPITSGCTARYSSHSSCRVVCLCCCSSS